MSGVVITITIHGWRRPNTIAPALPKRQVKAACVDAYARHLPGTPHIDLAADGLDHHRALADERLQRPERQSAEITELVDTAEQVEAA